LYAAQRPVITDSRQLWGTAERELQLAGLLPCVGISIVQNVLAALLQSVVELGVEEMLGMLLAQLASHSSEMVQWCSAARFEPSAPASAL
jgi:hypothetical protein